MKNTIAILILSIFFILNGCENKQTVLPNEDADSNSNKGSLSLHIHSKIGKEDIKTLDSAYFMASGDTIWVKSARIYISNIRLLKSDGTETKVDGSPILIEQYNKVYNTGRVIAGNYRAVAFEIGFSYKEENSKKFITSPSMLIGEEAIFVNFEGLWYQKSKQRKLPFQLNIGADLPLCTFKSNSQSITILPQNNFYVHLNIDYFQLLSELNTEDSASLTISKQSDHPVLYKELMNKIKVMVKNED
ncbi:MAG: hypothetical protein EAZ07_06825 [Cytophagales bacterium]|nr:MAG: hypothetical protein EAZ07_06825 [Cytophagales bacterium]